MASFKRLTFIPNKFGKSYITKADKDGYSKVVRKRVPQLIYNKKSAKVTQAPELIEPILISYKKLVEPHCSKAVWRNVDVQTSWEDVWQQQDEAISKLVEEVVDQPSNIKFKNKFVFPTSPKSRCVGLLNGKPLLGPLTKAVHYLRQKILNRQKTARLQKKILKGKLASSDYEVFGSYYRQAKKEVEKINRCQPTSIRQVKKRTPSSAFESGPYGSYVEKRSAIRSPLLAGKLAHLIGRMRQWRSGQLYKRIQGVIESYNERMRQRRWLKQQKMSATVGAIPSRMRWLDPQMDRASDDIIVNSLHAQDTAIIDQRIASEEVGPVFTEKSWTRLTSTDIPKDDIALLERNTLVGCFKWEINDEQGKNLFDWNAPVDPLKLVYNTPVSLLFKQHAYWRGDQEYTIVINSNSLMTGAVQLCWYYGASLDPSYDVKKKSIYASSQMLHTIAQAGSSNPMVLKIPFAWMYPYLPTVQRGNDCCRLQLGALRLQVLNRLQATSQSDKACTVSVFMKLTNNQFIGTVDASLGFAQMEGAMASLVVSLAESYLVGSFRDSNRDNPPIPNNPQSVQIVNAGNMGAGTNLPDMTGTLRLNPAGQTPYMGLNRNEMLITDFTRVFGLVHSARWTMGDAHGTRLGRWQAGPILDINEYPRLLIEQAAYHVIPPVGYISSLFKQTRGTIEYRFDFVCNAMYTGSVLVAYIPIQRNKNIEITLDMARSSTHVVFSLHESKSFTFVTPYITDRVWWPRKYSGGADRYDFQAPGEVYMFVLNPLCLNDIIPATIDINVYMRGGVDFEVSVPVQPSISSYYFPAYKTSNADDIKAEPGYFPYYVGTSRYFRDNKYALLRYGAIDDHIAYFTLPKDFQGYFIYSGNDVQKLRKKDGDNWIVSQLDVKYAVAIKDPGNEYYWLAICKDEQAAYKYAESSQDENLYEYPNDDADKYFGNANPIWSFKAVQKKQTVASPQGQRDDPGMIVEGFGLLPSTSSGNLTFGEDFSSLTTLLRRYQYMGYFTISRGNIAKGDNMIDIPVKPNGMFTFPTNAPAIQMRAREGNLSLIAACYRFFRGSVRYQFVCSTTSQAVFYVQHKPDIQNYEDRLNSDVDNILSQGYATYAQEISHNAVVKVEVPYYLDSVYGFLGTPTGNAYTDQYRTCHLGRLFICTDSVATTGVQYFSSLGDDAKFDIFQGTPPIKFLREESIKLDDFDHCLDAQGVSDVIGQGSLSSTLKKHDAMADTIQNVGVKLDSFIGVASNSWSDIVSKKSSIQNFFTADRFMSIVSQLVHMLISQDWRTIAWGISTIVITALNASFDWLTKLMEGISEFVKSWWESEQNSSTTDLNPQGDLADGSQIIGVLSSLVIGLLGVKFTFPGKYLDSMRRIFWDMSIFSRGLTGLINILRNIFECTFGLLRYYLLHRNNMPDVNGLLKNHGKELITWAEKCEKIMDPSQLDVYLEDDMYPDVVASYLLDANIYMAQLSACRGDSKALMYIKSIAERLRSMRDKLYQLGKHPYTRVTPCSIWLVGDAGIGKSTCVTGIVKQCLNSIGMDTRGQMIYKHEPGNDHWDTCSKPKFVWEDDAFCIRSQTEFAKQLGLYFSLVTNAPFTPPMAHLENKHMRIQPVGLITCSNVAYPKEACLSEPAALYRRRHIMLKVELKDSYAKDPAFMSNGNINLDRFTTEQKNKFPWLNFSFYHNPREETSAVGAPMGYEQMLEHVSKEFSRFHRKEKEALNDRINDMMTSVVAPVTVDDNVPEVRKKFYEKIQGYVNEKWSAIEEFVCANEVTWKERYKTNALRSYALPQRLSVDVDPQMEMSEFEVAELSGYLRHEAAQALSARVLGVPEEPIIDFHVPDYVMNILVNANGGNKVEVSPVLPLKGVNVTDIVPDDLIPNMLKMIKNEAISTRQVDEVESFITKWKEMLRKAKQEACMHKVCFCYQVVTIGDCKEYAIPQCSTCIDNCEKPVRLKPCNKKCILYDYTLLPAKWLCSYVAKQARYMYDLVAKVSTKLLRSSIDLAKTALKKTVGSVYWAMKKMIKLTLRVILPVFGIYFMGSKLLSKQHSVKVANKIGNVGGYVTGKVLQGYGKLVELFDREGNSVLVPQKGIYEGSNATKGTGRMEARNLAVRRLTPNNGPPKIKLTNEETYISGITKVLVNNTYVLSVEYTDLNKMDRVATTRGTFIRGREFLMVTHCWDELIFRVNASGGRMYLVKSPTFSLELDASKIVVNRFLDSNFCLLYFPTIVPEHKNIVKHIPTRRQHELTTKNSVLVTVDDFTKAIPQRIDFVKEYQTVRGTEHSDAVTMSGSYKYAYGGFGLCGSLLLCTDTNPCLIGMHVAGVGKTTGYSEPLLREMFEEIPPQDIDIVDVVLPPLEELDTSKHTLDGRFIQLGVVEAQYAHNESGTSNIIPSLAHGVFPVQTEPAPLSKYDDRLEEGYSPMYAGVEKLGRPIRGFPMALLQFARDFIKGELRTKVLPVIDVRPLNLQDAVCGRAGVSGFSCINLNTSEGFPLTAYRPPNVGGKKWLFHLEDSSDGYKLKGIERRLLNILTIKQRLREKGIIPFTVFTDCLKDARISKEKCSIPGKTRIFSTSPVDFSIQFRQYFLPYTVAHQNSRDTFSTAVGINVNGWEWSDIVIKMNDFSEYHACGDYSNFGAGFSMEVHDIVAEGILDWFQYNGDKSIINKRVRKIMFKELLASFHLCFDIIYQVVNGMPSGSPITVETNDLVNLLYIAMAWHEIMSVSGRNDHYHFNKNVRIKTYGDDLWLSISPNVIDIFNNVTIQGFFVKYDVVYTDADKTGEVVPYKFIEDVSFLKRVPRLHPFRKFCYLAELEEKYALDIANWCWKTKDHVEATLINLEACSDAMFGAGVEKHTAVRNKLMTIAHRLGHIGQFRSWAELDTLFFKNRMM